MFSADAFVDCQVEMLSLSSEANGELWFGLSFLFSLKGHELSLEG